MPQTQTEDAIDLLLGAQTELNDAIEALTTAQHTLADATVDLLEQDNGV